MSIHILPLNDERSHVESPDCECEPRVEWIDPETGAPWAFGSYRAVHNAFDHREIVERLTNEPMSEEQIWEIVEA